MTRKSKRQAAYALFERRNGKLAFNSEHLPIYRLRRDAKRDQWEYQFPGEIEIKRVQIVVRP